MILFGKSQFGLTTPEYFRMAKRLYEFGTGLRQDVGQIFRMGEKHGGASRNLQQGVGTIDADAGQQGKRKPVKCFLRIHSDR